MKYKNMFRIRYLYHIVLKLISFCVGFCRCEYPMVKHTSTEVNAEHMTLIIDKSSRFCNDYSSNSPKDKFEINVKEDNLNINNKHSFGQHKVTHVEKDCSKGLDETLEEKELIEIEKQWISFYEDQSEIDSDSEDEACEDLIGSEDENMKPSYPIQNVLDRALVRIILIRAAKEAKNVNEARSQVVKLKTSFKYKKPMPLQPFNENVKLDSKSSKSPFKPAPLKEENSENTVLEVQFPPTLKNDLSTRNQKKRIQSMIKNIEHELENDIGNGYGNLKWCEEYTKFRGDIKKAASNETDKQNYNDSNNKNSYQPQKHIPTPSWRIIDEYDIPDSISDTCDAPNIELMNSDDSDESDSSDTSTSTWVPSDTLTEYILPNQMDCDMNVEIRLVNLTNIQIQAVCKELKYGISRPIIASNTPTSKRALNLNSKAYNTDKRKQIENGEQPNASENLCVQTTLIQGTGTSSKINRPYLDHCNKISKPCLKELARLEFSNAGPKMRKGSKRTFLPLRKHKEYSLIKDPVAPTLKKFKAEIEQQTDSAHSIFENDQYYEKKEKSLTHIQSLIKIPNTSLQNEKSITIIEDNDFDKFESILATDCNTDSKLPEQFNYDTTNILSNKEYKQTEKNNGNEEPFEDTLDVIMSYVSSDNEDENDYLDKS